MGKVIDITEKLSFDLNPRLRVRGVEIEVNADAETVLTILGQMGDGGLDYARIPAMMNRLFTEAGRKSLSGLHLGLKDYMTVLNEAVSLITDTGEESEGGGGDPTMT